MAGSVNKVILIGNLGRDPESRAFQNGGKVVELRIATSEQWKDRASGERKEKTEWHTVKVFQEGAANFAERYLRKGSKVYVEGQLETRKWQDQSGAERYSTEVVIRPYAGNLTSLDSSGGQSGGSGGGREEWSGGGSSGGGKTGGWGNEGAGGKSGGAGAGGGFADDLDDDIPF